MHLGNKVDDLKDEATFLYEKARRLEDGIKEIIMHLSGSEPSLPVGEALVVDSVGGALPDLESGLGYTRVSLNNALGYLAHLRDYVGPDSPKETGTAGR